MAKRKIVLESESLPEPRKRRRSKKSRWTQFLRGSLATLKWVLKSIDLVAKIATAIKKLWDYWPG